MEIRIRKKGGFKTAVVESDGIVLPNAQGALDFMVQIQEKGCDSAIIQKSNVPETFFDLKTGLAGEILQKFTNYRFNLAIVGDYSGYASKSLKDFIYESNRGGKFLFACSIKEAMDIFGGEVPD